MGNVFQKITIIVCTLLITFLPLRVLAAEVLQVRSASEIEIGDNNRNNNVNIACLEIDPLKEDEATMWLKKKLPRHSRVNLLPKGSSNGVLVANIIRLKSDEDIALLMQKLDLAELNCESKK